MENMMDENLLLVAFTIFTVLVILLAIFFRTKSVDDIFSDDKASSISETAFSDKPRSLWSGTSQKSLSPASSMSTNNRLGTGSANPVSFRLNRENINKIGKILGAVGVVLLFIPLPDAFDGIALGAAMIGWLIAKMTDQPKAKPQQKVNSSGQISLIDTLRKLAGKPEYQEAMKMLSADIANKSLVTDADRQARAIRLLQSKGVSNEEATRNIKILASYISQQKKK